MKENDSTDPESKEVTYSEYQQWTEYRWELIDGIIYDMTPSPSRQHQKLSGNLCATIHNQLSTHPCEVYAAPFDVRLAEHKLQNDDEITTVVQPDIVVICDPNKLDDRGCLGAPDLIIEILSPATAAKDLMVKRDLYERHGVKEYWLVYPLDHIFMIYTLGDKIYPKATVLSGKDHLISSAVPNLEIYIDDIFNITTSQPE